MLAGNLDRRITIQSQTVSQSDSGQEIIVWSDLATVWAALLPIRGGERWGSQQLIGRAVTTFSFRWSNTVKAITVEHRVIYDGREFDIVDVREPKRREEIQIDCAVPSDEPVASL